LDRDSELIKIQAFLQLCNSNFVSSLAALTSGLVGIFLTFLVATLNGVFPMPVFVIGALIIWLPGAVLILFLTQKIYRGNVKLADNFLKKLEKSESLPSLEEMIKMIR